MREVLEREAELAAFDRLLGAADGGSGSVVLVTGEAGVGKTALARAFAERSVSRRVAVGWCERVSAAIPFGPLHDLAATLGDPLRAALAQESGLARVAGALLTALARPTLAIVEDIHWADTLTLDAPQIAGRRIDMVPSVLVITFRDDEAARGARALAGRVRATRLAPSPLRAETVDRLAARSGVDGARLMRATGGNPFLVEESLAAPEGVPATVHDAIVARTAPLSADARGALDVVAVYGERVSAPALARLLPGTDAVEECLDAGVLVANGDGVAFRHELIRTAVEEAISPPRRAELHARIARTLASEARADAGRTAYHAAAADLDDLARRAAARAAETALRVDAFHEARRV